MSLSLPTDEPRHASPGCDRLSIVFEPRKLPPLLEFS
jgi:hypothetical protein